jgi:transmembrane sensor
LHRGRPFFLVRNKNGPSPLIMTEEEFNRLVDKYLAGNATPLEERIINDFFSAQETKATLPHSDRSDEMWEAVKNRIGSTKDLKHSPSSPPKSKRKKWVLVSLVASMLFALSTWFVLDLVSHSTQNVQLLTSASSKGQKLIITMNDGSRVYMNSASTLSYPATFPSDKREVFLEGEAFFEVTRDENRPFLIHSGNITTKVLGTSFNVNAFDANNISVSVATGKVQVDIDSASRTTSNPSNSVVLLPEQQAIYHKQNGLTTASIDIERFIAWKNNTLRFEDASLQEVAVVLERWYNVTIEFGDPGIKKCRINGQYKDQTLNSVLESIQYMYKIKYEFGEGNKLRLYGKGC